MNCAHFVIGVDYIKRISSPQLQKIGTDNFRASFSFTPFDYRPFFFHELRSIKFSIMRALFAVLCVAGVLATVAIATPLTRNKRYAGGFTAVGPNFGGAFAGAGAGFNPYGMFPFAPMFGDGFPFNFVPMPVFQMPQIQIPIFKNWYEGENVCTEEKIMNSQMPEDVIPADWQDGMPNVNTDMSHEQESCKGSNNKYICVKRVVGNNGETQIKATKYECCHGFVRDPRGIGCMESPQSDGKLTPTDPTYYIYSGNNMRSRGSISSSSAGNLDKVPLQ